MLSAQVSAASRRALLRSSSPMVAASRRTLIVSSRAAVASRPTATATLGRSVTAPQPLSRSFHVSSPFLAETVKVPQMAESISEGTLKQWNKKKGDFVNADEEVATIETDKVSGSRCVRSERTALTACPLRRSMSLSTLLSLVPL